MARRLSGVLAVLNQVLGDDNGLIIGKDAVTVDQDRQVEVKGRRKADTAVSNDQNLWMALGRVT